jgi:hypothetical protein
LLWNGRRQWKKRIAMYYRRVMDENAYMVVLHEMYDTLAYSTDTLRTWISNLNSIESDLWLANEQLAAGRTSAASQSRPA